MTFRKEAIIFDFSFLFRRTCAHSRAFLLYGDGAATTPGVSIILALCAGWPAYKCCESALPCLDPHHPSGEKARGRKTQVDIFGAGKGSGSYPIAIGVRVLNSLMGRGNCARVLIKSILFRAFYSWTFSGNVSDALEVRIFYSQKNSFKSDCRIKK